MGDYREGRRRYGTPGSVSEIRGGVVHELPDDLRTALASDSVVLERWNGLTPLARNEWICWTISVKREATRANHVGRVCSELLEGKRRPCCWPGCSHR
ncbi:MAG: YdeI/OmpD-associated family protein [Alkalispirochaeta sp.]